MTRLRQSYAVPALAALCFVALTSSTWASTGPKWSAAELADFADVIVTGRVDAASSGWDPAVNSIYTYVTVEVDEVFKGAVGDRIIVKQLGGVVDGIGLAVADQATFAVGEQVLLYLEARPRDGSLYTAALWQGKWNLETGAFGERIAVRTEPAQANAGIADRVDVSAAQATARASRRSGARIDVAPADAATDVSAQPFAFLGPFRWTTVPPVDVQAGGQPGLSGGGVAQLATSLGLWNAAGTGTRLAGGSGAVGPKCTTQLTGTGRVTISFNDPCGEISDGGGTLAIGGAAFFAGQGGTNNGVTFGRAVEGFVINNNSAVATNLLVQPGCFQDIQLHELGHVLGLDHSTDTNAIMFPSINNSCSGGAHALGTDDRAGLNAIYGGSTPPGVTPPSTAPTNVTVTVNGTVSLVVSWNAVTAVVVSAPAAATSYRVDFRATPTGAVVASATSTSTTLPVAIPAGVRGTFYVSVTGINAAGAGPSSTPVAFTIGTGTPGPAPCTSAPSPVIGLAGDVAQNRAFVSWLRSETATSYVVQAGSTSGGSNHFPPTDIGNTNFVEATVPSNFSTFVTVFARNACGTSAGNTLFIQ